MRQDIAKSQVSRTLSEMQCVYLAFFLVFAGAGSLQQYLIPFLRSKALSPSEAIWILATVYIAFATCRILNLYILSSVSSRWALIGGLLSYALIPACLLLCPVHGALFACALLWGWGAAAAWMSSSLLAVRVDQGASGAGRRAGSLYGAVHAGFLLGVPILGALQGRWGTDVATSCALFLTLLGAMAATRISAPARPMKRPALREVIILDRRRMILLGLQFSSSLAYGLMLGSFADYVFLLHPGSARSIYESFYLARFGMSLVAGVLCELFSRKAVLSLAFAGSALGLASACGSERAWALVAGAAGLAIQVALVPVACLAMVGDESETDRPATYAMSFMWRDAGVACALLMGLLPQVARWTLRDLMLIFSLLFALCAALSLLLVPQNSFPAPEKTHASDHGHPCLGRASR